MDVSRVDALVNLPKPVFASQLFELLNAINWSREHIPSYGSVTRRLYEMVNLAMKTRNKRTKRAIADVRLDWNEETTSAYEILKKLIAENILLRYPTTRSELFLFSDASDKAHAAMLTQVLNFDSKKGVMEQ